MGQFTGFSEPTGVEAFHGLAQTSACNRALRISLVGLLRFRSQLAYAGTSNRAHPTPWAIRPAPRYEHGMHPTTTFDPTFRGCEPLPSCAWSSPTLRSPE